MITNLYLENFKGFGYPGISIPMNRITLLFGANSSGKTSIIQALLMLNQTITEATDPKTILLPNGNLVSLGNFREFVHKHDIDRKIRIGIESDYRTNLFLSYHLRNDIIEIDSFEGIAKDFLSNSSKIENWGITRFNGKRINKNQFEINLINYDEILNSNEMRNDLIEEVEKRKKYTQRAIELLEGEEINLEKDKSLLNRVEENEKRPYYNKMMSLLLPSIFKSIREGEETKPQEELKNLISYLSPLEFELTSELLKQMSSKELLTVFDDVISTIKKKEVQNILDFKEKITLDNPLLLRSSLNYKLPEKILFEKDIKKEQIKQIITTCIIRELFNIPSVESNIDYTCRKIIQQLSKILFLGPLRREPARYYFFSGNVPSNVGKKGDKTGETLFYSKDIQKAVNEKLNDLGIDYHINVTPISGETRDIFSLRLLDQTLKTDVSISEVGFGISQILPIIVQSYLSSTNTICIEQPEIHIHPRLQTELAQLFFDRVNKNKKLQYIIETHSEHIILRFQKLIRKKQLNPEDISVIYAMKEEEGIVCKKLDLDQRGDFIDPWPEGFFEEAFRERFG